VRQHYEATLRALPAPLRRLPDRQPRQSPPWLADLVIWRANRSPRILAKVQGVLNETHTPRMFTVRGMWRLMFQ